MKKFFHPLLITLVVLFPIISQATEAIPEVEFKKIPQGYILKVLSVVTGDIGTSGEKNTTLAVHIRRAFEGTSHDVGNTISAEHYVFDSWSDVKSFESLARFPEDGDVFLSNNAMLDNQYFYVCFELQNIGQSCHKITPTTTGVTLKLYKDKSSSMPFAYLRYKIGKAVITPITTEEFYRPNSQLLVRLDETPLMDSGTWNGFQIRVNASGKPITGFFGEQSPKDLPKVIDPTQTYKNDLSLMIPASERFCLIQIFQADKIQWNEFPAQVDAPKADTLAKIVIHREETYFPFSFYKIDVEPTYVNPFNRVLNQPIK